MLRSRIAMKDVPPSSASNRGETCQNRVNSCNCF
jgi:hypothetical protein